MRYIDLDEDVVDLICFTIAAILAAIAHFFPNNQANGLAEFANLAAGSALRGLGTRKGHFDQGI